MRADCRAFCFLLSLQSLLFLIHVFVFFRSLKLACYSTFFHIHREGGIFLFSFHTLTARTLIISGLPSYAMQGATHDAPVYGQLEPVYAPPAVAALTRTPTVPERPARVQVEQKRKLQQTEHLGDYNIWYGRYAGERREKAPRATTRVCLETDAGLTRADYTSSTSWLCLHFARGDCVYGKDCTYRHCAPVEQDESRSEAQHDVFGRDRHATWRDDMGGTGTWSKECRSLYVGRVSGTPSETQLTEIITRHFGEFGIIESVRVLKAKGCAFVTYRYRCTAEFAKEAMAEQALDHGEQINVRWAYDDPNPRAQAMHLRNAAQRMLAAMQAKGHSVGEEEAPYGGDATAFAAGTTAAGDYDDDSGIEDQRGAKRQRAAGSCGADADDAAAMPIAPMTREAHEKRLAAEVARVEAEATAAQAAQAAQQEAKARESRRQEALANVSRLEAVLASIGGGATGTAASSAGNGAALRGDGGTEAKRAADPLASFLRSVDEGCAPAQTTCAGTSSSPQAAVTPSVAAASSHPARADDGTDQLPPGVRTQTPLGRLPEGWREYMDPATGHTFYVSLAGESTWCRPAPPSS